LPRADHVVGRARDAVHPGRDRIAELDDAFDALARRET
jgi:hypothetical protein